MKALIKSVAAVLVGDDRHFTLEHRLFNTISLLNAITNVGGSFAAFGLKNYLFLLLLNLITGLLFFVCYLVSRLKGDFRPLYWPFVLLILCFLFLNALGNAGTTGGAHYYFIPALVIAVILSGKLSRTVIVFALFGGAVAALSLIEQWRPQWITPYQTSGERFFDVTGNILFVQLFTGILVIVLTRNLNLERRKSDQLLLNVLPASIAAELKHNDRVRPLEYEEASVLFTDFVGFTSIAENFTPQQLIEELDACFREFDRVAKKYRLEKIKTIGDSYMAVGGVPLPNQTHAVDCVMAALEIKQLLDEEARKRIKAGGTYWQIRIGIHTGELVAGVIGREKFTYDVWGDTVNTASRLESSGVPGKINISRATYERVKDFFDCEYRGLIEAKNKGQIEMYFVNGPRAVAAAELPSTISAAHQLTAASPQQDDVGAIDNASPPVSAMS